MSRIAKSVALLLLIDAILYTLLFTVLQLFQQDSLCFDMVTLQKNCQGSLAQDLTQCLDDIVLRVISVACVAAVIWIATAYLWGDSGTPAGLRQKQPLWWLIAGLGLIGGAAFGYETAVATQFIQPNVLPIVSLLSAATSLLVYFLGTVFATPWVLRGQVPGACRLAGRIHFP